MQTKDRYVSISLTYAQRRAISEELPQFDDRLRLDAEGQRRIEFQVGELQAISWCLGEAVMASDSGMKRNSLRQMIAVMQQTIRDAHGIGAFPPSKRLYQFKITLQEIVPAIWRRIQVRDCSLDKLHEHIQTAMGWTNSHLYRFEIQGIFHGDPELLCGDPAPDCFVGVNSLETNISDIVPQAGLRFRFAYDYDFGDRWQHDVLFEGCLEREEGVRYPLCLEGAGACPPEDVGGVWGYQKFLKAIADPTHDEHHDWKQWAGEDFDPNRFDAQRATRQMQRGLPDWRRLSVQA